MAATAIARIVIALLLAPLIGFLVLTAGMCAFDLDSYASCLRNMGPLVTLYGSVLAFPAAFLAGVPLFIVFRRKGWLKWWQVAGGGAICGLVGTAPVAFLAPPIQQWLILAVYCVPVGLVAGLAFWFLGLYRNAL